MVEDVERDERWKVGGGGEESRVVIGSEIVLEPENGGGG